MSNYTVRAATAHDALQLSNLRQLVDKETDHLDREEGEQVLSEAQFREILIKDHEEENRYCVVAEHNQKLVGFARLQGNSLHRFKHHVEFGVAIQKSHWGKRLGTRLLQECLSYADDHQLAKVTLRVQESNSKALQLYKNYDFVIEGTLRNDKRMPDGTFQHTVLMARFLT
ncbi:GNAT family N-acetyltransferase [Geomicrobium sp. JCM 19055]|uniref:GNAT family N-acetyltransferase n=1 Tax=Geomicrobium sp. JCM 19055 TaxID=1460649 RepID=UPI00045ECF0E|nr:GNAT family N-acetyltransferase [Geomicrobium sp. JCM 19055]GAJ98218.1 acetyltransferase, GNAT family [Geomicrobium sp. JCM 19055]